jgi:hypothetical protein
MNYPQTVGWFRQPKEPILYINQYGKWDYRLESFPKSDGYESKRVEEENLVLKRRPPTTISARSIHSIMGVVWVGMDCNDLKGLDLINPSMQTSKKDSPLVLVLVKYEDQNGKKLSWESIQKLQLIFSARQEAMLGLTFRAAEEQMRHLTESR